VTSSEVLQLCNKYDVVPELNCTPMRLDIDDVGVLTAVTQYYMPVALALTLTMQRSWSTWNLG